jgi:hypothetical protein
MVMCLIVSLDRLPGESRDPLNRRGNPSPEDKLEWVTAFAGKTVTERCEIRHSPWLSGSAEIVQ